MVCTKLEAAQPGKVGLRPIGTLVAVQVALAVIDHVERVSGGKAVPVGVLVGKHLAARRDDRGGE